MLEICISVVLREKEKGPRYDRAIERLLSRLQTHSEINVCVCVCVCKRERKRERERVCVSETLMEI